MSEKAVEAWPVLLEKHRCALVHRLSKELFYDVQLGFDDFFGDVVLRMSQDIVAYKCGSRVVQYPSNWREAVKERWLPAWAKKRWPVRYTAHDALAVFPQFLKKHPVPGPLRHENYYLSFIEAKDNPFQGSEE